MSQIHNDEEVQVEEQPPNVEIEEEQPKGPTAEFEERVGTRFCGCCCDYRIASIILNAILAIIFIANLAFFLGDNTHVIYEDESMDAKEWEKHFKDYRVGFCVVVSLLIVAGILGIVAAILYNKYLMGFVVLSYIGLYIADSVLNSKVCSEWNDDHSMEEEECAYDHVDYIVWTIVTLFFIYPNVGFMIQVHKGIMSAETYEREKTCCCGKTYCS